MIKKLLGRPNKKKDKQARTWYISWCSLIRSDRCADWDSIVTSISRKNLEFSVGFDIETFSVITRCKNKPQDIPVFGIKWNEHE